MNRYFVSISVCIVALAIAAVLMTPQSAFAESAPSPRIKLKLLEHQVFGSGGSSTKDSQAADAAQGTQATPAQNITPDLVSFSLSNSIEVAVAASEDPQKNSFFTVSSASFLVEDGDIGALGVPACFSYDIQLAVEATQSGGSWGRRRIRRHQCGSQPVPAADIAARIVW